MVATVATVAKRWAAVLLSSTIALLSAAATWGTARREAKRLAPVPVVVAARNLPAEARLQRADLKMASVAPDAVPPGAVRNWGEAEGRVLTMPLAAGQFVVRSALAERPQRRGLFPGEWPVYVPLRDGAAWGGMLQPGDRVSLVQVDAAGKARVLATGLRVVAIASGSQGVPNLGLSSGQAVAVLAAPAPQVPDLDAAIASRGTVVLHLDPWS